MEVRASGGYEDIIWLKGNGFIPDTTLNEYVHFFEVFYRDPTTTSDYGSYEALYFGALAGEGAEILVVPTGMLL